MIINAFNLKAQAPPWQWAKGIHTNVDEFATDVAFDPSTGNLVSVGVFNSDISAFLGPKFIGAIGGGYVAKYDPTGAVIWAFPIGNNQDDACNGVTVDASGNIYVTGYLQQIADFKGMSFSSAVLTSSGGKDVFLAKYNPAGQLIWATQAGGGTDDEGTKVCVTANGVYITGYYTGQANFGGIGLAVLNGANIKGYAAAYDVNANPLWAVAIGNNSTSTYGNDICADNNNVFLTGQFTGASVNIYDAGLLSILSFLFPSATLNNASASSYDGFTTSFTANGGLYNWASTVHSNSDDYNNGITQAGNNVYITGATKNNADFTGYAANPVAAGANGLDIFTAQLSKANGNANWVKSEPGNNDQQGISIAIDTANLITIAGWFNNGINFIGGTSITSSGNEDVFVATYDISGNFKWVNQAGDNGTDMASAVTTGNLGEIYAVGQYEKNAVFGATTLTQDSPPNSFIAKIFCPPILNNLITSTQTVCANQTPAALTGSTPTVSTGTFTYLWEQSANNTTWTTASGTNNAQNYSPPIITANTYYHRIVTATGGCSNNSISTSVLINVNQIPTTASVAASQTICATTATLTANAPSVGTGIWTGAGITTPSSSTTTATGLTVGNNNFIWTISNGVCASSSSTLTVHADAFPSTSFAGNNQVLCAATTTTLQANNPSVGTGVWSVITSTANIISPTNYSTNVTSLNIGQTIFMWSITNGTCPSSTSTVSIQVDAIPSNAVTASNQTLCANTTTISANSPTVGTGVWNVIVGSGTVTSPASNTSTVTGLSIGQNSFVWTISNGSCTSSSDTIYIQVDAQPTPANAGINQTICAATTTTLAANNPSIGNGVWTVLTGSSTVTSPTLNISSITNLNVGQNSFIWTISNGTCASSRDTVTIQIDDNPSIAVVASNQTLCASTATISANVPIVGNGIWSVLTGTSTVTSPTTNTTTVTGLSITQNNFIWTISNGVCPSSSDTIYVQQDENPTTALAAANQTICASNAIITANNPTVGTGIWTVLTGSSTVTSTTTNSTSVTALNIGQNSFVWTISNGVCPSSKDTTMVQVDANPSTSVVGADQIICASNTTISANAPTVGTGNWSVLTGTSTVTSSTTNTTSVTGLSITQNAFVWTISNGVCASTSDTIYVQQDESPTTALTAANQTICTSNAVISANNPTVGTGVWTLLSGTQTISSSTTSTTSVTNLSVGQNGFVWTITNGVCPFSSDTTMIQVDANPDIAIVASNQTLCASTTTISANVPTVGIGIWSVISGTSTVTSPTTNITSVTGLSIAQNNFVWTISNGVCPSSSDTIYVQQDENPTTALTAANQTICASNAIITANNPIVGFGTWTLLFGTQTILSPTSNTTSVANLNTGQNGFVWTISNGVCPSSKDTTMVQVDANPSTSVVGADQIICAGNTTISANNPSVGNGIWTVLTGTSNIVSPITNSSSVTGLSIGQNDFVWTISNGVCPSSSDTMNVQVDANPSTAIVASNQTICASNAVISANSPIIGVGTWTLLFGTQTILSPTTNTTSVANLTTGQNGFIWTISNGVCPSSSDTTMVQVDANPSIAIVASNQTLCASTGTISANNPTIGNGLWSVLTGTSSIISPTTNTTSITNLNVGQNDFIWTISNGVCPSSSDTMNLQVDAYPSIAVTASNQTLCITTSTISANIPVTGSGVWSVLTGTSSVASFTTNTTSVTNLNIGQNNFVWTISNGVCPSSSDTMNLQVDAHPSTAIVSADQTICASTTTISGNNPAIGNGLWSVLNGTSTITSPTTNNTSVTNLNVGANSFIWTISNGVCASSSDTIIIKTDAQPTSVNAGADQALCSLTTSTLTANSLTVGNGVWTVIAGTGTLTSNTSANTAVSNLNIGQNIFVWTVTNGVCPSSIDTIVVHIDALPTIANAGQDTIIYNSIMSINANAAVVGTGLWSIVSGNANFADNLNPSTEITGLENGQTIIQWTISNGVCPTSVDELIITIKSLMVPNGFSPNNDGVNDNFEIKGLEEYSNVKLNVVNRWGSTVYENIDYKNNWNGKNLSGEDLSDDTYFFILEIPDKKTYNGFVVLKRK